MQLSDHLVYEAQSAGGGAVWYTNRISAEG